MRSRIYEVSTPADLALSRALAATDPRAVLVASLEAWQAYPSVALADLVIAASARVATTREVKGSLAEQQATWLEVCAAADPIDLPWLLEHVITSRKQETLERLRALAKREPDPRTSAALVERCAAPELRSHPPVWTLIFSILRKARDRRMLATIGELHRQLKLVTDFDREHRVRLLKLEEMIAAFEPPPPPHPQRDLLDQLARQLLAKGGAIGEAASAKTALDFMIEVWAAPLDDAPRAVFAAWLLERGDPRGELITLQLARARDPAEPANAEIIKRERALLSEHHRAWMGELEPVVSKNAYAFERGFLARAEVPWRKLAALPALMTHPAWATVREYKLASEGEKLCDRWLDHMIALGAKRM